MKVLVNRCYGGYGISPKAFNAYMRKKNIFFTECDEDNYPVCKLEDGSTFHGHDIERNDPLLVQVFEELGSEEFSGFCSNIGIETVPDNTFYSIHEYDGMEYIDQVWITATLDELKNGLSQEKLDLIASGCDIKLEGGI